MPRIVTHWDADGVTAGLFTSFGVPNSTLEVGEYSKGFGNVDGLTKEDWLVDMKPQDPTWNGNCIDHHFPHSEDRKYKLIPDIKDSLKFSRGTVPATYIAWDYFKDKIPKSEWWKICIGLGGDGGLELTPTEVFEECPILLKRVKTSAYQSYGWKIGKFPLYKMLSSSVNAFLRRANKDGNESALYIMKAAKSPLDIWSNEEVQQAREEVKREYTNLVRNCESYLFGLLGVVIFESNYRMSGYVSSSLSDVFRGYTIMSINKKTGSVSLRGDLSPYYKQRLASLDYLTIDGHTEFMGGKLRKSYITLLNDLSDIL